MGFALLSDAHIPDGNVASAVEFESHIPLDRVVLLMVHTHKYGIVGTALILEAHTPVVGVVLTSQFLVPDGGKTEIALVVETHILLGRTDQQSKHQDPDGENPGTALILEAHTPVDGAADLVSEFQIPDNQTLSALEFEEHISSQMLVLEFDIAVGESDTLLLSMFHGLVAELGPALILGLPLGRPMLKFLMLLSCSEN